MPVPLPVTSFTGLPVITAVIALEAVVLAMPISPVAAISIFFPNSSNTRMPFSMDFIACRRVIAGPCAIFLVP